MLSRSTTLTRFLSSRFPFCVEGMFCALRALAHGMVRVEIEIALCVGWLYVDRLRLARNIKKISQCQTIIFFCNPCARCTHVFGNLEDVFVGAPCASMDFLLSKSQSQKRSCKIKKKLSELAMTIINVRTAFNW